MTKRLFITIFLFLGITAHSMSLLNPKVFCVQDFGTGGDGKANDSAAIQSAIDACAEQGGGTVLVPAGTYKCANVQLKSNVHLRLDPDAVLLMDPAFDKKKDAWVIGGFDLENTGISGSGTIDGSSLAIQALPNKPRKKVNILRFDRCKKISVSDVTLRNSYAWVQKYSLCRDLKIDGVKVNSRTRACNDGMDIDSCQRVNISRCNIISGDDSIVLKSTYAEPTRDVVVSDCTLSSLCSALKLGTESYGGFENIVFEDCLISDNRSSAIALNTVDGGDVSNIVVRNITINKARTALTLRRGARCKVWHDGLPKKAPGIMRDISVSNVQADGIFGFPITICGIKDAPIENVSLDNIRVTVAGGAAESKRKVAEALVREFERVGDQANAIRYKELMGEAVEDDALSNTQRDHLAAARKYEFSLNGSEQFDVPEVPTAYPDDKMFGPLPAYGLYARYVENLSLNRLCLRYEQEDLRPAIVIEKSEDIRITSLQADGSGKATGLIRFNQVHNKEVSNVE